MPTSYGTADPATTSGSYSLPPQDTGTRIPVRGPEYPTIRPNNGGSSLADAPAPQSTTYGGAAGTYGAPASPASRGPAQGLLSKGPAPAAGAPTPASPGAPGFRCPASGFVVDRPGAGRGGHPRRPAGLPVRIRPGAVPAPPPRLGIDHGGVVAGADGPGGAASRPGHVRGRSVGPGHRA